MFNKNKFKACIVGAGLTQKEVAEHLGIAESTLWRKIQNDGAFSRKEIRQMVDLLDIENPNDIFFAETLA